MANVAIERRNPVRNVLLQQGLAAETGGKAYDLQSVDRFPDEFQPVEKAETSVEIVSLWSNWLVFVTMISLLVVEWSVRKLVNLS